MLLPLFLLNETRNDRYLEAFKYLKSPVLVFHDETNLALITIIQHALAVSHTIITATPNGMNQMGDRSWALVARSLILIAEDAESVVPFIHGWKLWNPRDPVLLILKSKHIVRGWLDILWTKLRVVNAVAMVDSQPSSYFTWFPYKRHECTKVSTITEIKVDKLFPSKITKNLNRCTITAVTTVLLPIVIDKQTGLEPRIVQLLGQKLKAKLKVVIFPREENVWISFDSSGNPIRGMKMLWENTADMMFSNIQRAPSLARAAEFTISHTQDDLNFFVPAPLPVSRAMSLFRAFRLEAWIYVVSAFCVICLSNLVIPWFSSRKFYPIFLQTLSANLNLPFKMPQNRAHCVFIIFTYIYALHITTAYTSCLLVFLSDSPKEKAIKSIEDLINSGFVVQALLPYQPVLPLYSAINEIVSEPNRMVYLPFLDLPAVKNHQSTLLGPRISYAMAVSSDIQYYDDEGLPNVHIIKPPLCHTAMSLYMSIGHPLLPRINTYLQWMVESGLPEHYLREFETPPRAFKRTDLSPLQVENIIGAFYMLSCGLIISIVCFAAEMSLNRGKEKPNNNEEFKVGKKFSRHAFLSVRNQNARFENFHQKNQKAN